MPSYFILVPILLPVIVGILLLIFPIEDAKKRNICMFLGAHINIRYLEIVVIEFKILQCMEKCHLKII